MAAPPILRPALQGIGGRQRLQRFADITAYPTLTAAADALGRNTGVLSCLVNRLERDLGRQLLVRAQRSRPMVLTAFGAKVVRAVEKGEALTAEAGTDVVAVPAVKRLPLSTR